jgi:hypothetical protein
MASDHGPKAATQDGSHYEGDSGIRGFLHVGIQFPGLGSRKNARYSHCHPRCFALMEMTLPDCAGVRQ